MGFRPLGLRAFRRPDRRLETSNSHIRPTVRPSNRLTVRLTRVELMARVCSVCGKGPVTGNNVSHANNRTKRRWYPNLQTVRVLVEGAPKRVRVCTQCLKSNRITKAPKAAVAV